MWAQSQAWEACEPMMVKVDSPATVLVGSCAGSWREGATSTHLSPHGSMSSGRAYKALGVLLALHTGASGTAGLEG